MTKKKLRNERRKKIEIVFFLISHYITRMLINSEIGKGASKKFPHFLNVTIKLVQVRISGLIIILIYPAGLVIFTTNTMFIFAHTDIDIQNIFPCIYLPDW